MLTLEYIFTIVTKQESNEKFINCRNVDAFNFLLFAKEEKT